MSDETPLPKKRTGLGRGLSSLLGEIQAETSAAVSGRGDAAALPEGIRLVPVVSLQPLPNQPRRNFDDAALDELARSIKALGVLQPIVVRDLGGIIRLSPGSAAGAQRSGLSSIRCRFWSRLLMTAPRSRLRWSRISSASS